MRRRFPQIGRWTALLAARRIAVPNGSAIFGSAVITGAQITATFVFALASVYLVRTLSTDEFGRATFGINAHFLLLTIAGFGLTTGVIAEIARGRGSGGVSWPTVHALLIVRVASAVPVVAVGLLWATLANDIVPAIAAVAAALFLVQHFLIGVLAGELRSRAVALVLVAQPVTYALLLVLSNVATGETVLGAMVLALALALALAVSLQSGAARRWWSRPRLSVSPMAHAFWVARYAYIMTFLQMGFIVLPIVLFGTLNRYAEGAALSIVMTLVRFIPDALSLMIVSAYFPRLRALPAAGTERTELFNQFARIVGLAVVPAALGLAILGMPVLDVLFAGRYNYLAADLAIVSLLVVVLPIEALLTWTLVSEGAGRTAVLALTARLAVVLVASAAFVLTTAETRTLGALVIAYPVAVALSVSVQFVRARQLRAVRIPVGRIALFAAATGATFVAIRVLVDGSGSSPLTIGAALASCVPLGALGAWLSFR